MNFNIVLIFFGYIRKKFFLCKIKFHKNKMSENLNTYQLRNTRISSVCVCRCLVCSAMVIP